MYINEYSEARLYSELFTEMDKFEDKIRRIDDIPEDLKSEILGRLSDIRNEISINGVKEETLRELLDFKKWAIMEAKALL